MNMNLKQVLQSLGAAKATLAELDREIAAKRSQIEEIERAPAHIDDVVAWVRRGLDAASATFRTKLLSWYWSEQQIRNVPGAFFSEHPGPQLLALHRLRPSYPTVLPPSNLDHTQAHLDLAAVTHFLRPLIERELEGLVREAYPDGSRGMRRADREQLLVKERRVLQDLEAQRAELLRGLRESADIVSG